MGSGPSRRRRSIATGWETFDRHRWKELDDVVSIMRPYVSTGKRGFSRPVAGYLRCTSDPAAASVAPDGDTVTLILTMVWGNHLRDLLPNAPLIASVILAQPAPISPAGRSSAGLNMV
jgi:hypothetical protein